MSYSPYTYFVRGVPLEKDGLPRLAVFLRPSASWRIRRRVENLFKFHVRRVAGMNRATNADF